MIRRKDQDTYVLINQIQRPGVKPAPTHENFKEELKEQMEEDFVMEAKESKPEKTPSTISLLAQDFLNLKRKMAHHTQYTDIVNKLARFEANMV